MTKEEKTKEEYDAVNDYSNKCDCSEDDRCGCLYSEDKENTPKEKNKKSKHS